MTATTEATEATEQVDQVAQEEQAGVTERVATAETITVDQDKQRKLEHYRRICELTKEVRLLQTEFECKKSVASMAKKEFEVANIELLRMIAEGPDPQLKLFEDDEEPKGDEAWRECGLAEHTDISDAILKLLKEAGIETVGQLSDWTSADKKLTDIDGIGAAKAEAIELAMMGFWAAQDAADDEELDPEFEVVDDLPN